jgi:hypothetical protein
MVSYWLARGGQKFGPYSIEDLQRMAAGGTAFATDLLWKEGMPAWAPFTQIVPLPGAPPPPPPTPPAAPPANQAGLIPPSEHWALILALGCVTLGIVPWVWLFKQANFARKLDPQNRSTLFLALALVVSVAYLVSYVGLMTADDSDSRAVFGLLALFLGLTNWVLFLVGIYKVRRSMLNYYNQVEPINLRLSGVMTFFFNVFYFQHHFRRIARWKQTGFLEPQ